MKVGRTILANLNIQNMIADIFVFLASVAYPLYITEFLQKQFGKEIQSERTHLTKVTMLWTEKEWKALSLKLSAGANRREFSKVSDLLKVIKFTLKIEDCSFEFYCDSNLLTGRASPLAGTTNHLSPDNLQKLMQEVTSLVRVRRLLESEQDRAKACAEEFGRDLESIAAKWRKTNDAIAADLSKAQQSKTEIERLKAPIAARRTERAKVVADGEQALTALSAKQEERRLFAEQIGTSGHPGDQRKLEELNHAIQADLAKLEQIERQSSRLDAEITELEQKVKANQAILKNVGEAYERATAESSQHKLAFDRLVASLDEKGAIESEWKRIDKELAPSDKALRSQLEALQLWHLTVGKNQRQKSDAARQVKELVKSIEDERKQWQSRIAAIN